MLTVEVSGWHLVMVFDGRMSNDPPVQMILIIYSWTKPLFWVQIILVKKKKKKRPNHLNSYIFKTVTCLCLKNPSVSSQANINLPFQGTPISNFPPPLAHQGSDSWSPTFPLWLIADLPISWVETQKCRCPSYLTDLKDPRTSHSQTSF